MPDDRYREGTTFEKIYRIYDFDRRLRNLLLMIIERIELYFRAQIAYYHAHRYGPLGYLNEENYNKRHHHDRFIAHIEKAVKNNAQQPFVAHYIQQYDAQFPIWVIVELLTVGELSTFYDDLPRADKKDAGTELSANNRPQFDKLADLPDQAPELLRALLPDCTSINLVRSRQRRWDFRIGWVTVSLIIS